MNFYELSARYDARKSFYGKAIVVMEKGVVNLYSYETLVATFSPKTKKLKVINAYSQTTNRHIREFARQNNIYLKKVKEGVYE